MIRHPHRMLRKLGRGRCLLIILTACCILALCVVVRSHVISREVTVVVVEEHHEVLPYWLKAVHDIIPRSGNILLHIDGHSDDAPPDLTMKHYPLYRQPRNQKELQALLQSNDVFIMEAIGMGMFERLIWVWPSWDTARHEEPYTIVRVQHGDHFDQKNRKLVHCMCRSEIDDETHTYCLYLSRKDDKEHDIPKRQCRIKGEFIYEEIEEETAVEMLQDGKLFSLRDSVILDIDEDFFGCESAGAGLVKAGIRWSQVEQMNEMIDSIICPSDTPQEVPADDFLMTVIRIIVDTCGEDTKSCEPHTEDITYNVDKIMKGIRRTEDSFFCKKTLDQLQDDLLRFVKCLLHLSIDQIKAITKVGFCLETTPKAALFDEEKGRGVGKFKICTGWNKPADPIVSYHSPSNDDMVSRKHNLRSMLVHGQMPDPKLVTVCRSVRDGFTPRRRFKEIERAILTAVKQKVGLSNFKLKYDKDLLGGKLGWPVRHGSWHNKL